MATDETIRLRLTIGDPVAGVTYSLQDKASAAVGPVVATEAPLSFDVPVRLSKDGRLTGDFVRREGPERRFVYIAIGTQAGETDTPWSRRAKIDVHDIAPALLQQALAGAVLECRLPGRAKDGGPACATVRPLKGWQVVD
ncbi:DUF5990 family protein [Zavarzinia sp. CC-PAN008]|uniref:DUF5990 family protein n=1 Tax=Zavarzinia sp. CC-PAN008 TaxID=3243332 RepID=UPI003F742E43